MKIYWSGTTRYHDWFKNKNETLQNIIYNVQSIGLLKNVDWLYEGINEDEKEPVSANFELVEYIKNIKENKRGSICINMGGSKPFIWDTNFLIFPFVVSMNQIRGINMFNFYFEDHSFLTNEGSDFLADTFKKTHNQKNTEFSFIHPYKRYYKLTESLIGAYQDPLTFSPMFSGVFWIIYLGEEHLKFFDISKLQNIECYEHEWTENGKGLYMRVTRNILESDMPEIEEKMILINEQFRKALI